MNSAPDANWSFHHCIFQLQKPKLPNFYFKFLSRSLFSGSGLGSHGSCDCGVEFLLVESNECRAIARYEDDASGEMSEGDRGRYDHKTRV
jgi:hypothetical protein